MTETAHESIDELSDNLQDIYNEIEKETDYIQKSYGADGTLVLISTSEGSDPDFRSAVGEAVVDVPSEPCGFVLSDGPSGYEEYLAAYVREEPEYAYEYVLGYCTKLGVGAQDIASLFGTTYSLTKDESEDYENPRALAASFIYVHLPQEFENGSISDIAAVSGVSEANIRNQAPEVVSRLKDYEEE